MTVVIGQQFMEGIVLIADSRVSVGDNPWGDVAQKVFFLGPDLAIGFAGDLEFAGTIIYSLIEMLKKKPEYGILSTFIEKAPELMGLIWEILPESKDKRHVGFVIVGLDRSKPQKAVDANGKIVTVFSNMFEMRTIKIGSPDGFKPQGTTLQEPFVIIGTGKEGIRGLEQDFRDLLSGSFSDDLSFKAIVMESSLRARIQTLGIKSVGGLSQIAVIGAKGSRFVTYEGVRSLSEPDSYVELVFEKGRFIQKDHKTGKQIKLLSPLEVIKLPDHLGELFARLEETI